MNIGKYLVFVGGLTTGAVVIVAAGALQKSATPQEAAIVEAESSIKVVSPKSPFAVASDRSAALPDLSEQTVLSVTGDSEIQLLLQRIEFAESRIEELETLRAARTAARRTAG